MKVWLKILLSIMNWAFDKAFDYIDKNKDGAISKEELDMLYTNIKIKSNMVKKAFKK